MKSGLSGAFIFKKNAWTLDLVLDAKKGRVVYERAIGKFDLAATGGFLSNTPWVGPRACVRPIPGLKFMAWKAWTAGEKFGSPDWKIGPGLVMGAGYADVGAWTASYTVIKIEQNRTQFVPGLARSWFVNSHSRIITGAEYDETNNHPMFRVELSYKP